MKKRLKTAKKALTGQRRIFRMKKIILKNNLEILLDDEDYKKLAGYTWRTLEVNGKLYAVRSAGINAKDNIYMHREVLGETGRKQITHINGNSLDNRNENLQYRKKRNLRTIS
jgi:hypothetical protein